ncbi:MAG: hypothetical protein WC511_02255 [Candidatus Pacearchaeota archaeon]
MEDKHYLHCKKAIVKSFRESMLEKFVKDLKNCRESFMELFPQETEIEQEFTTLSKKIGELKNPKE